MSLEDRGTLLKRPTEKTISQEGGFLGNALGSLMKAGLQLMKNVLSPLANSLLIPIGLTAAVSATDATIQKKIYSADNIKRRNRKYHED